MSDWPRGIRIRPISDRTAFTGRPVDSPFRASWSDTLDVLDRELHYIRATNRVLELDIREQDIRLDGYPRADANAGRGVRLAFDSRFGPLVYATDRFCAPGYRSSLKDWQHNVRAIALGLEALRRVDRYGITRRGEQYVGWKALPGGSGAAASHMTREDAARLLAQLSEAPDDPTLPRALLEDPAARANVLKRIRGRVHPDRVGGDRTLWNQVDQAAQVLEARAVTADGWSTPAALLPRPKNYRGAGYRHPNQRELRNWRCIECRGPLPDGRLLYCGDVCSGKSRARVAAIRTGNAVA